MKRFLLLIAGLLAFGATEAQVKWVEGSTDQVRELAVKADKLVFIDLYADWCGPCRMMEERVFKREEVGDYFDRHFVAAKYNVDRPTGRALMQRYGRGSIPFYLILNTDGELLGTILGAYPAEEFLQHIERIVKREGATKDN